MLSTCQKFHGHGWLMESQIASHQQGLPLVSGVLCFNNSSNLVIPLLHSILLVPGEGHSWSQRQHLDALNVLAFWAKPCCQMHLALEVDAGHMIFVENLNVIGIAILHQEELFQCH